MKERMSGATWEEEEDQGHFPTVLWLCSPPPNVLLELYIFFPRLYCFAFETHSFSNFTTAQLGKVLVA